jgi:hypothetical protein
VLTVEQANRILGDNFVAWILDLLPAVEGGRQDLGAAASSL